jgi:hypothetical protein
VVGKDAEKLRSYYGELFGWEFDSVQEGPTDYATVARDANVNPDGVGIGGASTTPRATRSVSSGPATRGG